MFDKNVDWEQIKKEDIEWDAQEDAGPTFTVYEETVCPDCSGSGEGPYEGTICHYCKGRGTR